MDDEPSRAEDQPLPEGWNITAVFKRTGKKIFMKYWEIKRKHKYMNANTRLDGWSNITIILDTQERNIPRKLIEDGCDNKDCEGNEALTNCESFEKKKKGTVEFVKFCIHMSIVMKGFIKANFLGTNYKQTNI